MRRAAPSAAIGQAQAVLLAGLIALIIAGAALPDEHASLSVIRIAVLVLGSLMCSLEVAKDRAIQSQVRT